MIRRLRDEGQPVYEVTQLINSLLGLLVFPSEKFFRSLPRTQLARLQRDGWPIPQVVGSYQQARHLQELIRYLRNAVAHFNVEFLPKEVTGTQERPEITGLRVWNTDPNTRAKTWEATLSLRDLEGITEHFLTLVLQMNSRSS